MRLTILLLFITSLSFGQCKSIKKEVDKYDGKIYYSSPYDYPVAFSKRINTKDTLFWATFTAYGSTLSSGKGIVILLENGIKIDIENDKIKYDYSARLDKYTYTYSLILTKDYIDLIKENKIIGFRLYIYEGQINPIQKNKIAELFNCINKI